MRQLLNVLACLAIAIAAQAADVTPTNRAPLQPEAHYSQTARRFARQLPEEHLKHFPIDDTSAARAWTNFINALDGEHLYFLQSDIESFRPAITNMAGQLKAGNVDVAFKIHEVFVERLNNRYDFVTNTLEKGFDLNTNELYRWKRRDLPWPSTPLERDEVWRLKIKNEYIQQIIGREMAAANATNTPPPAETSKPDDNTKKPLLPSPEEVIRNRYKQLLISMNDNDAEWVFQRYLSAFTTAYDPHSSYMSPTSMDDFDIEMKLSLVGIGALLSSEDGAAKIVEVIAGGPADLDKRDIRLQKNDKIIAVGEDSTPSVDILHMPLNKIVKLIRGKKGTRVILTVIPGSDPTGSTTKTVDLIRDEVKLEERAASARYEDVIDSSGRSHPLGIITLPTFYANMKSGSMNDSDFKSSAYDVAKVLTEMNSRNVEGVILDLRSNGGGSLLEAIKMVGLFISTGPTVQVKERYSVRVLPDLDPDIYWSGPLVVLINRLSASASEIVAGALQDYGRAIIVGDSKTHGKGSVQTILDVGRDPKFGSIKVTTASYYRISGASTQLKGITPDIVISSPFDFMELGEEFLPHAMEWNTVTPARYYPVADLTSLIPPLRENSEKRRSADPRFAAYDKVLERVKVINHAEELPLNIDERRKFAKSEKVLTDLEDELDKEENGAESDKKKDKANAKSDLVLSEGLKILADLSSMQEKKQPAPPETAAPAEKKNIGDTIADWFRSKL